MFTVDQLIAHLVGDYLLQSSWMSRNKAKSKVVAIVHGLWYSFPFLFFAPSFLAWFFIFFTHAVIDHYRLARPIVIWKNRIAPINEWDAVTDIDATGYAKTPDYVAAWLYIIADNLLHVGCNAVALRWL